MVSSLLDEYLQGAFLFEFTNGLSVKVDPTKEEKAKFMKFFTKKDAFTEVDFVNRSTLEADILKRAWPNEPIEKINQFVLAHEPEILFLFYKHFGWLKCEKDENYEQYNIRTGS